MWLIGLVALALAPSAAAANDVSTIRTSDGVDIAVECAGEGDTLLIVHGGTGDRTRWLPVVALLEPHMRACAMDRRGHGESGDAATYSLEREAMDVVEVAQALPGKVSVLGHSYGGMAALEAALRTGRIERLILYEPPLQDGDHGPIATEIERLWAQGREEEAAELFFTRIVQVSPSGLAQMKAGPNWRRLVASVRNVPRIDRVVSAYRWDPQRVAKLQTPTLLLRGEHTPSPQLRLAVDGLQAALPDNRVVVLQGQEHNAMDTGRELLAAAIKAFLSK